jgi:hypothetical protein
MTETKKVVKDRAYWEAQVNKIIADQEGVARSFAQSQGVSYESNAEYFNSQIRGMINDIKEWLSDKFPV